MRKSITVGMLVIGGLVLAGCSQEAKTKIDKAKETASKAAESTKDAAGEIAGKAGEVLKSAEEGVAASAAKAIDALKDVAGGPELLKKVTEFFASAGTTLKGVTDADSAKAVLPKLTELTASTDDLSKSMANLPEGAKAALSGVWEKGIAELKALVEKAMALPGVESVLKPAANELMAKLGTIAGKKS